MKRRHLLPVVLLLLVVAACGTGTDEAAGPLPTQSATTTSSAAAPQRAPAADPVLAPVLAGRRPQPAPDPAGLARQLAVAETAIRDPQTSAQRLQAAAWTAQVAYRALARRPGWDRAVLAAVPPELHAVVRHNTAASREFQDLHQGQQVDTLPAWRIVEPMPAGRLREIYAQAQHRFGVPWQVLAAVHLVETATGRIVGESGAGAQGPMQFMPATWDSYGLGGDVWDTRDAVMGAANYLAANGAARGELDRALYRYNNDTRYVRVVRHYASVMRADERAFPGYHARQVYYRTTAGDILLPVGYDMPHPIPVRDWLSRGPR